MEQIGRPQVYSSSASECYQTRSKPRENEAHEVRSAVHFTRDHPEGRGSFWTASLLALAWGARGREFDSRQADHTDYRRAASFQVQPVALSAR
jgi:hypothetical protein